MGNLRSQGQGRKEVLAGLIALLLSGACRTVQSDRPAVVLAPTVARPSLLLKPSFRTALGRPDLRVEVRLRGPLDNVRRLVLSWDSALGDSGSHSEPLPGGRSAPLFSWLVPHLSPGSYSLTAALLDGSGRVLSESSTTLTVLGMGEPEGSHNF